MRACVRLGLVTLLNEQLKDKMERRSIKLNSESWAMRLCGGRTAVSPQTRSPKAPSLNGHHGG